MDNQNLKNIEQKVITPRQGLGMLVFILVLHLISAAGIIGGIILIESGNQLFGGVLFGLMLLLFMVMFILYAGLKVVGPNEALVLTLFGNYYGTILKQGFFYVNPFCVANNPNYVTPTLEAMADDTSLSAKKGKLSSGVVVNNKKKTISLKSMTLNNGTQKVNDVMGNPIIVGAVVIWRVDDPTKAAFNVENFTEFLSIQTDSTIRNIARLYPYDTYDSCDIDDDDDTNEKTLRGSSQEIALSMKNELEKRVEFAGLCIEEVRITHLSYSEEIAAAMLQRQQASAIIAARTKIVDGAVSMVKMAIDKLNEDEIVILDEERKAQMVSNLLVVLCSNKDTQPVVNSGTIY